MKYVAIWYQTGGCDYTIGCGIAVRHFEASDLEAAKASIIADLSDPEVVADDTADSLHQVVIYEVTHKATLTPEAWQPLRERANLEAEERAKEAKERVEYERLKKKFQP